MDMNLAWLKLASSEEGTPERVLSELLRRRGVGTVLRVLGVERVELARWCHRQQVPDEQHVSVCEAYKSLLASDYRSGVGKIDLEVAQAMAAQGEKQEVIAVEFGVSPQAVSKALKRSRAKRAKADG